MAYFTADYSEFFKELAANNHKEWFDANRKRYEKSVKEPFNAFVGEMIRRVRQDDPNVQIQPKDAMFRVNRDIRFSKDKTPYKTQMSAVVSRGGRKDTSVPGIYFELGPEMIRLYGGAYSLSNEQIHKIRTAIANNLKAFDKTLNDKEFKEMWGDLLGEQHKRLPKEFQEAAEKQPLIANKQFYYHAKLDAELITKDELPDLIMDYYHASKPMKDFLGSALGY